LHAKEEWLNSGIDSRLARALRATRQLSKLI
jgi:hypothetical protein